MLQIKYPSQPVKAQPPLFSSVTVVVVGVVGVVMGVVVVGVERGRGVAERGGLNRRCAPACGQSSGEITAAYPAAAAFSVRSSR